MPAATAVAGPPAAGAIRIRGSRPVASKAANATHRPSGDQAGCAPARSRRAGPPARRLRPRPAFDRRRRRRPSGPRRPRAGRSPAGAGPSTTGRTSSGSRRSIDLRGPVRLARRGVRRPLADQHREAAAADGRRMLESDVAAPEGQDAANHRGRRRPSPSAGRSGPSPTTLTPSSSRSKATRSASPDRDRRPDLQGREPRRPAPGPARRPIHRPARTSPACGAGSAGRRRHDRRTMPPRSPARPNERTRSTAACIMGLGPVGKANRRRLGYSSVRPPIFGPRIRPEPCLDHVAAVDGQPLVAAVAGEGQALVVEAEQVEDRGVQVVDVDPVLDGVQAELVGGAEGRCPPLMPPPAMNMLKP